jgi:ABC-type glutathione transport system ATPase component
MADPDHHPLSQNHPLNESRVEEPSHDIVTSSTDTLNVPSNEISEQNEPTDLVSIKEEDQNSLRVGGLAETHDDLPGLGGLFANLQKAVASDEADALLNYQSSGTRILEELVQILSITTTGTNSNRAETIKKLQERANTPRTILGVVGATGHGKSSLINALLGEEKLVSTISSHSLSSGFLLSICWLYIEIANHVSPKGTNQLLPRVYISSHRDIL